MPTSPDPKKEQPSTYMVQNRSNREEMTRLQKQDRWTTSGMGGVLAEQPDPASLRSVLDIGCGTGGWLLETARTYPDITLLVGADISGLMLTFAREQAQAQGLNDRVEFHVMDALRKLEFPDHSFDLVNIRSSISYVRMWDWPKLLQECSRVCRPGGVVRITEWDPVPRSNSPAMTRLFGFMVDAFYQAGHIPTPQSDSLIRELPNLLDRFGFQQAQTREHKLFVRTGTEEWQLACDDVRLLFRTTVPFLQKWTRLPDDYQEIYQQMLTEIEQPDFASTTIMLTVWGNTPS